MARPRVPIEDRLMSRVTVDEETGCWLFTGKLPPGGYGYIGRGGANAGQTVVHRVSYELHVGPIPDGLTLDHLCAVKNCVNPAHLEPVTRAENTRRARLANDACPQGHPYDGRDARGFRICSICNRAKSKRWRERRSREEVAA